MMNSIHSKGSGLDDKDSIRDTVRLTAKKFDVTTIPVDMQRVYGHLKDKYGEEYGLYFVFTMRTAIELHRAWHMTLLTSKILQQIKDKFGLRMTWELGVVKLKFRVEDGGYELHRKVPYDYDSEYQDIYMRIAIALIEGQISIHEALIYQTETKNGVHTARSGIFLRDFPGRLVLYPFEAATCAVIFFGGDWADAGVAAICGFTAGLLEYIITLIGGDLKILVDVVVGISTGLIGGLFYHYSAQAYCLPAIFLGTLYWYFYGTAFVIGLLEIMAGELETGVTRFIAVSVKTLVLSVGASIGLMIATSSQATDSWFESQEAACNPYGDLSQYWWRIPLYLLCSVSVLGQYRLPIVQYVRGLTVQLAAYEVQYRSFQFFDTVHKTDNLDTSVSNIVGAAVGVVTACSISWILNQLRSFHRKKLLQETPSKGKFEDLLFSFLNFMTKISDFLQIGRKSDYLKLDVGKKLQVQMIELKDPSHPRQEITLPAKEENLILETIVGSQELNVWSILMPAVYQLVPGSIIARLWFNAIFPPPSEEMDNDSVFSSLMVISASLALGLIIGFVTVQVCGSIFWSALCCGRSPSQKKVVLGRMAGMYSVPVTTEDDPDASKPTGNSEVKESNGEVEDSTGKVVADEVDAGVTSLNAETPTYFPVALEQEDVEKDPSESTNLKEP